MKATTIQVGIVQLLRRAFPSVCVRKEWSVDWQESTQVRQIYEPRVDVAAYCDTSAGNHHSKFQQSFCKEAPTGLRNAVRSLAQNPNPRCMLAIEVVCSGSSKHILGDITNASMMGLYGIVVTNDDQHICEKVERIQHYAQRVKALQKAPTGWFDNVLIVKYPVFQAYFD